MENYQEQLKKLKESVMKVQSELDAFAAVNEARITGEHLAVKFYSRAGIGDMTVKFSDLARAVWDYDATLEATIKKAQEKVANES